MSVEGVQHSHLVRQSGVELSVHEEYVPVVRVEEDRDYLRLDGVLRIAQVDVHVLRAIPRAFRGNGEVAQGGL